METKTFVYAIISVIVLAVILFGVSNLFAKEKESLSKEKWECKWVGSLLPSLCENNEEEKELTPPIINEIQNEFLENFVNAFNNCKMTSKQIHENKWCRCNIGLDNLYEELKQFTFVIVKQKDGINLVFESEATKKIEIENPIIFLNDLSQGKQGLILLEDYGKGFNANKIIITKEIEHRSGISYLKVILQNKNKEMKIIPIELEEKDILHSINVGSFIASKIGISNINGKLLVYIPKGINLEEKKETKNPFPICE